MRSPLWISPAYPRVSDIVVNSDSATFVFELISPSLLKYTVLRHESVHRLYG